MSSWITNYFILSSLLLLGSAVPVTRQNIKPHPINYRPEIDNTTSGYHSLNDGYLLTISEGFVIFLDISPGDALIYYDGYDGGLISMDFLDPVSAVGMDWIANDASVTLSVYNKQKVLLESYTMDWKTAPKKAHPPKPYGFIGIDVGDGNNQISYATIDTPLSPGNELFVGVWIYRDPIVTPNFASPQQSPSSSPEPSPIPSSSPSPICERCNEAYRTEECQAQEKDHPDYLSADIMDCNYDEVIAMKDEFECVQHLSGCDTWVCSQHIPEERILKLTYCPPVIVGSQLPVHEP